jgi:hypothetical protein
VIRQKVQQKCTNVQGHQAKISYTSAHHLLHSCHSTLPTGSINTYASTTPHFSATELTHNQYPFQPMQFLSMRGTPVFQFHYCTRPCQLGESITMQIKLLTSVLQTSRTSSIPFSLLHFPSMQHSSLFFSATINYLNPIGYSATHVKPSKPIEKPR